MKILKNIQINVERIIIICSSFLCCFVLYENERCLLLNHFAYDTRMQSVKLFDVIILLHKKNRCFKRKEQIEDLLAFLASLSWPMGFHMVGFINSRFYLYIIHG